MVALPGQALLELIIGSTILPALIYGAIVVLDLVVRRRLERTGGFDLGRFEVPVAVAALIWVAVALFVLATPADALVPNLIVVGIIAAGGIWFARNDDLQPRCPGRRAPERRRARTGLDSPG